MTSSDNLSRCYLCGTKENLTRDHIPPENLFPKPKPNNLVTVACCNNCNSELKLIDESFRVFVSSTLNRSIAGRWIWDNKVMDSTFKRSPKLKAAVKASLIDVDALINNQIVKATALTYPEENANKYLIRLTKGFTRLFHPEIDYTNAKFKVWQVTPNQEIVDGLFQKFPYFERGDNVFRMWRGLAKGNRLESIWVYVFYDDLMFAVSMFEDD